MTVVKGDAQERKAQPVCTGVLDYFPDALLEVAKVSKIGNDQHNPGQPLHWAKEKSTDEADALVRHLIDRGKRDSDGTRHSAKVAWRALALLQREIEAERALVIGRETPLTEREMVEMTQAETRARVAEFEHARRAQAIDKALRQQGLEILEASKNR